MMDKNRLKPAVLTLILAVKVLEQIIEHTSCLTYSRKTASLKTTQNSSYSYPEICVLEIASVIFDNIWTAKEFS